MAKITQITKRERTAALKALNLPTDNVIYSARKLKDGTIEIRIPGSNFPLIYNPQAHKGNVSSPKKPAQKPAKQR